MGVNSYNRSFRCDESANNLSYDIINNDIQERSDGSFANKRKIPILNPKKNQGSNAKISPLKNSIGVSTPPDISFKSPTPKTTNKNKRHPQGKNFILENSRNVKCNGMTQQKSYNQKSLKNLTQKFETYNNASKNFRKFMRCGSGERYVGATPTPLKFTVSSHKAAMQPSTSEEFFMSKAKLTSPSDRKVLQKAMGNSQKFGSKTSLGYTQATQKYYPGSQIKRKQNQKSARDNSDSAVVSSEEIEQKVINNMESQPPPKANSRNINVMKKYMTPEPNSNIKEDNKYLPEISCDEDVDQYLQGYKLMQAPAFEDPSMIRIQNERKQNKRRSSAISKYNSVVASANDTKGRPSSQRSFTIQPGAKPISLDHNAHRKRKLELSSQK